MTNLGNMTKFIQSENCVRYIRTCTNDMRVIILKMWGRAQREATRNSRGRGGEGGIRRLIGWKSPIN